MLSKADISTTLATEVPKFLGKLLERFQNEQIVQHDGPFLVTLSLSLLMPFAWPHFSSRDCHLIYVCMLPMPYACVTVLCSMLSVDNPIILGVHCAI